MPRNILKYLSIQKLPQKQSHQSNYLSNSQKRIYILCFNFITINICKYNLKETWPLKKMYVFCTDPSCHNWIPDFLLVKQNSFNTAYLMNFQNKPVLAAWICTLNTHSFRGHISFLSYFQMYIMTPILKTSRRLLLVNIVRYTFLNKAVLKKMMIYERI